MPERRKDKQLEADREDASGRSLTTQQGIGIADNQNSLKAGLRGPSLLEDFILREKITHFDHERIPERVVHARGSAAHGYFELTASMSHLTRAKFLQSVGTRTPVFVRFSTVAGSRGSADTVRDVRGFATKFYTDEGVFDLVGNNIPVFFIQDAIKFPDLIHAVKPEPNNEIPQAASAHDTFWDFAWLTPECTHMLMWHTSDRAIPRSYRMMEGFGVNTYRLVNAEGKAVFVKFHWKPVLGVHSLVWDECKKINGNDPDFHRRDLWDAIDSGTPAEWEFGVQVIEEQDELKFDFDPLDATKIWPEALVPVQKFGKLVLNRNPDNFFAETEQVAFCPANVVPGIDFSEDPLLQGRLFSYLDTQLSRLGSPNFAELPINRPTCPVHNNQRDGHMRREINVGRTSYQPNSLGGGCPVQHGAGFVTHPHRVEGRRVRERSPSFSDHFTQATLFWNSMSPPEKDHIVDALRFELGKVQAMHVRERMIDIFLHVHRDLAARVAEGIGVEVPKDLEAARASLEAGWAKYGTTGIPGPARNQGTPPTAPELSMAGTRKDSIATRKVAILAGPGVKSADIAAVQAALKAEGALSEVVGPTLSPMAAGDKGTVQADKTFMTAASVLYDAVFVPCGTKDLLASGDAIHFVDEAYKHHKTIGASGAGVDFVAGCNLRAGDEAAIGALPGMILDRNGPDTDRFVAAMKEHRHWGRAKDAVPA